MTQNGWKLATVVPPQAADAFANAFETLCYGVSVFEIEKDKLWRVEGFMLEMPAQADVTAAVALATAQTGIAEPAVECMPLPPVDWVAETQKNFQPLRAGRYFIQPSHFDGAPPAGAIALTVDAGAAFGTGEHATTKGCLLALGLLAKKRRFRRPLDLGCGTGILAMAAAATWRVSVRAADIDSDAVRVATENAHINGLMSYLRVGRSVGYAAPLVRNGRPYDLIIANILAKPLVQLAKETERHLTRDGVVVLSGLLVSQERMVLAAYRQVGLKRRRRITIDGWQTLILGR